MENRLYLYNLGIKTFGGFATLGGVIQALQLFTQPDLDIKSILLSFPAWVVYVFVCLTIIFAMLRERYKSMSQRVEVLNVKLNEQDAMIRSLQEMMKIVPFKGRFFLTTEYLYNELGEYIQNNIDIDSIEIKNTIEKRGMGNKRDSFVRLNIRGVVSHKISSYAIAFVIQILISIASGLLSLFIKSRQSETKPSKDSHDKLFNGFISNGE